MVWKQEMILELEDLQCSLQSKKSEIEAGVDNLEAGKKARDIKKKEILLREIKQILAKLNEIDKKVIKDLKGEAFDIIRSVSKATDEIATMKDLLKNTESNRNWESEVKAMKVKVDKLGIEEFVNCLDISVSIQPGSMAAAFEKVTDAIFLETPWFNPKDFCLEVGLGNPNYVDIKIHIVGENAPASFLSSLVLQKLMLTMMCQLPGEGIRVIEECSVLSKIEKKKATVSEDGGLITVQMKRPNNMFGKISVHLLGSNIVNSPILHKFNDESRGDPPATQNFTLGNDSIGIFDTTGLDQSDLNSLDMTARQQMLFPAGKQHLLSNPTLQASPAYQPLRKVSRQPNVASVPEIRQDPKPQLSNTLPFSPYSEGMVSTMRATVASSKLAGALHQLTGHGTEDRIPTPENSKVDHLDESNLSILAPSRTSALSIDDMQRSLSGSESGSGDKSMVQLDRSVRFAPQTQLVEVLSTPQVSASSSSNRFCVAQGQTKSNDGQAGPVKRLNKDEKNGVFEDIWDSTELDTEELDNEEYNPASAVTLPLVTSINLVGSPQSCIGPNLDSFYDEDPHLMLNASKAPSPQSSWGKEDSIWANVSDCDEDEYDDNEDDEYDEYNTHPHLMLNASKAPEVGADWPSVDPSWDCNTSLLPESCFNQSLLHSPPDQDNNQTIWETVSLDQVGKFDICHGSFEVSDVYEAQPVTSSSFRGTKHCLVSPHSITYLAHLNYFLVTEPDQNRVGLYEASAFEFNGWLRYPEQFAKSRQNYTYPTSIRSLTNGSVVLIERNRLHVFDRNVTPLQSMGGVFHGLTEGSNGEIFTLGKNKVGHMVLKKFIRTRYRYKWAGQILIRVAQEFENWEILSKARFLLYNMGKIFITDQGLHKMYIVDMTTGKQVVRGYFGSNPGQFKHPTGLLADDMGNLLVGDSGNNRLGVYTDEGKFVKVVGQVDWRFSSPHDLVRQDNSVIAVFRGGKEGAIVRYRVQGDSGLNTPDTGSEVDA